MAATYVAGGDMEYGRYDNPTWRAFEEALGDLEGGRCLAFASGLAAVSTILDLVGNGREGGRAAARLQRLGDAAGRPRGPWAASRPTSSTSSDTEAVVAACEDASLVWIESPTNPAMEVADIPTITKAAHEAGAYVVVDNTFATPMLQQPLEWDVDLVVHSATKFIGGHADLLMGAIVTRDEQLYGVLKGRRDLVGAIPGAFEAWLALRGLRTLPAADGALPRPTPQSSYAGSGNVPTSREVRYPGFGGMISIVLPNGGIADLVQHSTKLWVYATSLGGVESTLERRRRWKTEPATIPDGLIRLSVGIEDVEDLWEDLVQALDASTA